MMFRGDVSEALRAIAEHHCSRFIERVPANLRIESANRLEAFARVHFRCAAGMKAGHRDLVPVVTRGVWLPERWPGNPEARIAIKFREHRFGAIRLESKIRVEPQ